jgi:PIN domain nuclease of toxin-antitoxin system
VIYLDTHVAAFLYQGDLGRFSADALRAIEEDDDIRISPMVVLELEFLHEIKRIRTSARRVTDALASDIGLKICDTPFAVVANRALEERWTRDPFDRFIVAQARLGGAPLITRDREIRVRYSAAIG